MESVFIARIEIGLVREADFGQDGLDRDFGGFDKQIGLQQPLFVQQFRERLAAALFDHVAQIVFVEVQPFGCSVQSECRELGIDQLEDLVEGVLFAECFAVFVWQRARQFIEQDRQVAADDLSGKDLREEIFVGHIVDDLFDVLILFVAEQYEIRGVRVQRVVRQQYFVEDAVVVFMFISQLIEMLLLLKRMFKSRSSLPSASMECSLPVSISRISPSFSR